MTPEPPPAQPAPPASPKKQRARSPFVTLFLIGANLAAFAAMVLRGASITLPREDQLVEFGANFGLQMVVDHEWWRAFTCMFVHIGLLHLAVNMYSLWAVGSFVERMLGGPKMLAVYVLTGLAGSFAMMIWDPTNVSAGASGAIFGLFGVVVGFTFRAREQLPPETFQSLRNSIIATLGFNLVFAVTIPNLGHAAHLGGLLAGVLAGFMATSSALEGTERRATWGSLVIVLATVVGLAVLADTHTRSRKFMLWELDKQRAEIAVKARNWEEAARYASRALEKREHPLLHEVRGLSYLQLGKYEQGLDDLSKGELSPMSKNNMAWAMVRLNRELDKALQLANEAVASQEHAAYLGTRCWVLVARGELDSARKDCERAVKLSDDDLMDLGMLRFIAGDYPGALTLWEEAAKDPINAQDLEPWLERARNPGANHGSATGSE